MAAHGALCQSCWTEVRFIERPYCEVLGLPFTHDLGAGFTIESSTFFTLYYLITGFHALHVVLGLIILAIVAARPSLDNVETGAAFWHMVDLVWLLVFPVIYLVR